MKILMSKAYMDDCGPQLNPTPSEQGWHDYINCVEYKHISVRNEQFI